MAGCRAELCGPIDDEFDDLEGHLGDHSHPNSFALA
jgi:hypothetical protein